MEWYPITEEVMIVNNKDLDSITATKEKELKNWRDNAVYCEVENEGQNTVSCRWVIEIKKIDGLDVTKARLVAQGFEDDEARGKRKDSPTCSKESLRITLALIAASKWNCKSMDIRQAFLQGNSLEREIFIKPPKEADSQGIWRPNKCVYGLNEASRYWYNQVRDKFLNMGLTKSKYDDAMFFYKPNKNGQCEGIIVIHVDDFLYGGSSHFEKVTNEVHRKFIVGSDCHVSFKYVGIDVNRIEFHLPSINKVISMGSKKRVSRIKRTDRNP